MKITVDLRSTQSGLWSGVETYIDRTLEQLLKQDRTNQYTFFYNQFRGESKDSHLRFLNVKEVRKRWPNRLLNASLRLTKRPLLDSWVGPTDLLWLPNFGQIAISNKPKLALTVHDLSPLALPEMYDIKRQLWHKSLPWKSLASRADKIFAVSEYTKQDIVHYFGLPEEKIVVTHLGVDHSIYKPSISLDTLRYTRNKYNLPGRFILFLGTLEPRKNIGNLLRAFDAMKEECFLVLAGRPGWRHQGLAKQIKQMKKSSLVKTLGQVDEADKAALYRLAKAFAFPSFYEGFGLPVVEAMATGTPVVTSSVSSLPEVAGKAAILVHPDRPIDLASALDEILSSSILAERLSVLGMEQAKQFTWEATANKTLEALNSLKI